SGAATCDGTRNGTCTQPPRRPGRCSGDGAPADRMLTGVTPRHAAVRRRGPGHARRLPRHRIRRAVGLTLVAVVGFVGTGAATTYARLQNNITSAEVTHRLGGFRPPPPKPDPEDPAAGTPVNILVIGSDTRAGNERFATDTSVQGERSDTTIVVHISA